jgi:hypothetical protein
MAGRLKPGALGGPYTFNGRAAEEMLARYSQFGEIVHFPTTDEAMAAALRREVDATCAPEQTSMSGVHAGMLARMTSPDSKLHVIAELARGYACSLLGKPGATIAQVRRVLGYNGSIAHSRVWLEANPAGRQDRDRHHPLSCRGSDRARGGWLDRVGGEHGALRPIPLERTRRQHRQGQQGQLLGRFGRAALQQRA